MIVSLRSLYCTDHQYHFYVRNYTKNDNYHHPSHNFILKYLKLHFGIYKFDKLPNAMKYNEQCLLIVGAGYITKFAFSKYDSKVVFFCKITKYGKGLKYKRWLVGFTVCEHSSSDSCSWMNAFKMNPCSLKIENAKSMIKSPHHRKLKTLPHLSSSLLAKLSIYVCSLRLCIVSQCRPLAIVSSYPITFIPYCDINHSWVKSLHRIKTNIPPQAS